MNPLRSLLAASACLLSVACFAQTQTQRPRFVERVSLDWDYSGKPTIFTLSYKGSDSLGDADRFTIRRQGAKPWILINKEDAWAPYDKFTPLSVLKMNLVKSRRMLFVRAGSSGDARIYLILKGAGYGCCVGSLWVLTPGDDGTPKVVFHREEHLLDSVTPLPEGGGIELTGQASDAEAIATNATSYDPFRVYRITGASQAKYDLERSKQYNVKNYCGWAGSSYDEKLVAVTIHPAKSGTAKCTIMTSARFDAYRTKHPEQFPID